MRSDTMLNYTANKKWTCQIDGNLPQKPRIDDTTTTQDAEKRQ